MAAEAKEAKKAVDEQVVEVQKTVGEQAAEVQKPSRRWGAM